MGNVVNRTTLKTERSVNTPAYPVEEWIINPFNFDAIEAIPLKYRKLIANTNPDDDEVSAVAEMDAAEKAVVDTAEQDQQFDLIEAELDVGFLKAVVAGLVKELNATLPARYRIDPVALRARIRNEIRGIE